MLEHQIEKGKKYSILHIQQPKIHNGYSPDIKSIFTKLHAEGIKYLIVNLSQVTYIDSFGLGAFLVANHLFKNAKGKLVLVAVSEPIIQLIQISQLQHLFTIVPNTEEAKKLLTSI